MQIEKLQSLDGIEPRAWDDLVGDGCPFFEHGFLSALADGGCLGPDAGWVPRYLVARKGRDLQGGLPLYYKTDSFGEFIFDWGWAEAAERAGWAYYPKLVVAAPFSPVGGPRFLVAQGSGDAVRHALLDAAREIAADERATGIHWLFLTEPEANLLAARGLAIRQTHQFHWHNQDYRGFDDFLGRFRSKRRNQIQRERRAVRAAGVTTRVIEGEAVTASHMDHIWDLYRLNVAQHFYGRQYLTRRFFDLLHARFRKRLLLILAFHEGRVVAGTFNVRKGGTLYGRYWGARREIPYLHFEVCAYAAIEACIDRGIQTFEPGAGGHHKLTRGFLPTVIRSAHEIYIPALDRAVRRFIGHEKAQLARELCALDGRILKPSQGTETLAMGPRGAGRSSS